MCQVECACEGRLPADRCPLFPACDACVDTTMVLVRVRVLHGETVDDAVGRYVEPRPRDERAPLMN